MQRFQSRTALVDEHVVGFLKIVTELGGYCTLEQAKALELANSNTRVSAYLKVSSVPDSFAEWPVSGGVPNHRSDNPPAE